jgi:hypothetical protein
MSDDFGSGVSRTLTVNRTALSQVIHEEGRTILDVELNLGQQIANEGLRVATLRGMPSGFLGDSLSAQQAFVTRPEWSNWFQLGTQAPGELAPTLWANVNGWLLPITGTKTGSPPGSPDNISTWNRVTLDPPPSNSGDSRVDFVFLEVWRARLAPDPSSTNKPAPSSLYRDGNVESGASYLPDESKDPALGYETSQRVQTQYRIRVVSGLTGLNSYPDGFDPATVKARGTASSDTAFTFTNMGALLGDTGLWRAGDGTANTLGTVDGYVYAIPISVIFRRNTTSWDGDPGQNLNGAFNRNPSAVDRTGWKTFGTVPVLASPITSSQLSLTLASATNIPLPSSTTADVYIQVGDEIMTYRGITGTTVTITGRGRLGTKAEAHPIDAVVQVLSGRPDGLFSDEIALSDILDLRHMVSQGTPDYQALLQGNFDRLLKGELKANWKRSGGGPQGNTVAYQDKISASAAALGVTKLDAPDGIRKIWSDASVCQPIEFIATPPVSSGDPITTTWNYVTLAGTAITSAANKFDSSVITIPISQFKASLPGSDQDQVSFPILTCDSANPWVKIRIEGQESFLNPDSDYTVTPITGPSDNLVISLPDLNTSNRLFITLHVQYGAGRGMSRRPDAVHSVAALNATSNTVLRQRGIPANNTPMYTAWAPMCSAYRNTTLNGLLPVSAESYVDPGSKTVVLTPWKKVPLVTGTMLATVDSSVNNSDGVMPPTDLGGDSDPLGLFCGSDAGAVANTYLVIPRYLIPGWGDVFAPIVHTSTANIFQGINFGIFDPTGDIVGNIDSFLPSGSNGADTKTFATFSTTEFSGGAPTGVAAPYSEAMPQIQSAVPAGIRKYTDSEGSGKSGLELPPFYGVARLLGVYEATDWSQTGSPFNSTTRLPTGSGATNLLRQDVPGPSLFITSDDNTDSTFVVSSECLDLTKSPNAIASFDAGQFVVEAVVFGFDRGSFDLESTFRLVLPRVRTASGTSVPSSGVSLVVPSAAEAADSIAVNYSRTPYQGDAWGGQTNYLDIGRSAGPLRSADAYQISSTDLQGIVRLHERPLEVLASLSWSTTLGTGRMSGSYEGEFSYSFDSPGTSRVEGVYPPATSTSSRPLLSLDQTLSSVDAQIPLGTSYHGCTERLPLGSLYRDADFRGNVLASSASPLAVLGSVSAGGTPFTGLAMGTPTSLPIASPTQAGTGSILVQVDGETSNYLDLTNFRTARGGSVYVGSGPRPGGEVVTSAGLAAASVANNSTLSGNAYLVRNYPTSVGLTNVSPGGEIMMLVVSSVTRAEQSRVTPIKVVCGTNGSGEGYSAADLYRVSGHPLTTSSLPPINTTVIPLTRKAK